MVNAVRLRPSAFRFVLFVLILGKLTAQTTLLDPLGWQGRWDSYLEKTYSWKRIGIVVAETSFDQMFSLHHCGRPPYCFHQGIEQALARRTTRTTIELAVGGLLHEDIRRQPSGLPGLRQRITYALIHAPLAKGREGEWRPAYSRFAGTLGGVAVSSALQGKSISDPRVYRSVGWSLTAYFQDALWTEFEPDLKRMAVQLEHRFRRHDTVALPRASDRDAPVTRAATLSPIESH